MPIQCHGVTFELLEQGAGNPLVYLHSGEGLFNCQPVLDAMASTRRVIAPSHPGFGHSTLPAEFARIDDLAYCYLDLFDQMGLENAVLVGESFGAWIAMQVLMRLGRVDDGFLDIVRAHVHHVGFGVIDPDDGVEMGHTGS